MRLTKPLPPGSVIGILGGGQLGRMLALAAARLGLKSHIYAPKGDNPAFNVAFAHTEARYDDRHALESFADAIDIVTYEFENVPAETAAFLGERLPLAPGAEVLAITQDRLTEKSFLSELRVGVAAFAAIDDEFSLEWALNKIGRPAILKTRRLGYDGKGQIRIGNGDDPASAWAKSGGSPSIVERLIDFEQEISVIAARSWDGAFVAYDIAENEHENHILRRSAVPAKIAAENAEAAQSIAHAITSKLDYVGVIGIEMFVTAEGVLVNEIAPRVHNSGHWTIDACVISQFEQHIRAIVGWPLGDPYRHSDVVMTNLLGDEANDWIKLASRPLSAVHLYGKLGARPGRKMGHVSRLTPRQA
jgi:5-(carboxyamino)imidazole ribonucleotide synthase